MTPGNAVQHILRDLPSAAVATFLALFPIVNPFGAVPMFFTLTATFPPADRTQTALRTAAYVIAILVVFLFLRTFRVDLLRHFVARAGGWPGHFPLHLLNRLPTLG